MRPLSVRGPRETRRTDGKNVEGARLPQARA